MSKLDARTRVSVASTIKDQYWQNKIPYKTAIAALVEIGYSDDNADEILHPLRDVRPGDTGIL